MEVHGLRRAPLGHLHVRRAVEERVHVLRVHGNLEGADEPGEHRRAQDVASRVHDRVLGDLGLKLLLREPLRVGRAAEDLADEQVAQRVDVNADDAQAHERGDERAARLAEDGRVDVDEQRHQLRRELLADGERLRAGRRLRRVDHADDDGTEQLDEARQAHAARLAVEGLVRALHALARNAQHEVVEAGAVGDDLVEALAHEQQRARRQLELVAGEAREQQREAVAVQDLGAAEVDAALVVGHAAHARPGGAVAPVHAHEGRERLREARPLALAERLQPLLRELLAPRAPRLRADALHDDGHVALELDPLQRVLLELNRVRVLAQRHPAVRGHRLAPGGRARVVGSRALGEVLHVADELELGLDLVAQAVLHQLLEPVVEAARALLGQQLGARLAAAHERRRAEGRAHVPQRDAPAGGREAREALAVAARDRDRARGADEEGDVHVVEEPGGHGDVEDVGDQLGVREDHRRLGVVVEVHLEAGRVARARVALGQLAGPRVLVLVHLAALDVERGLHVAHGVLAGQLEALAAHKVVGRQLQLRHCADLEFGDGREAPEGETSDNRARAAANSDYLFRHTIAKFVGRTDLATQSAPQTESGDSFHRHVTPSGAPLAHRQVRCPHKTTPPPLSLRVLS